MVETLTLDSVEYPSYATLAEANETLRVDLTRQEAWDALNDDAKATHLVAATRRLDILPWRGAMAGGPSQATAWPRRGMTYPGGEAIPEDAIPLQLKRATILVAGSLASDPGISEAVDPGGNIRRVEAGSAEVEFFHPRSRREPALLSDLTALALVRYWLAGRRGLSDTGNAAFGTDERAETQDNEFGREEGFA